MIAVKVTGFRNLDSLVDWASHYLVDIGHVSHAGEGVALISPDEDNVVESVEDFHWFRDVVRSALDHYGSPVNVHPDAVDPTREEGLLPLA